MGDMATTQGDEAAAAQARPFAESRLQDLVVITGFSGAGKSTAMAVFEDAGYFCVDNLPPEMIRSLVELFAHQGSKVEHAAVVSDVRGGAYFETLSAVLDDLAALGLNHRVLFLDADEGTLITRYKETRRRHPASPAGSVTAGIAEERAVLDRVRSRADVVLDVRFLPNPHYVAELKPLTGRDERVVAYVGRGGKLDEFYGHVEPLLDYLLPQYVAEGKAHLTVAIGCTGGRHRSVAIAEHLGARYQVRDDVRVDVTHRDITKADKRP